MQLCFDFVLVPLVRAVKTRVQKATCAGIEITTHLNGRLITAVVPDWVIGKGTSFLRGWLKVGYK